MGSLPRGAHTTNVIPTEVTVLAFARKHGDEAEESIKKCHCEACLLGRSNLNTV